MTKSDLASRVHQEVGPIISKAESRAIVDTMFASIMEALIQGNRIEIRGFGVFQVRERRARIGQNLNTGEPVEIPERRVPVFKPSKIFCHRVEGSDSQ